MENLFPNNITTDSLRVYEFMGEEKCYKTLITEKENGVKWIKLNRPHRLNAFNLKMIKELSHAVSKAEADEEVRCIVIKGIGDRAFSTGADITIFKDLTSMSAKKFSERGQSLMNKIENSSKPYIAALHGFCLGGGLEIALVCDFRIADESAELGSSEIKLGIIPGWGGTQRLSRVVGLSKAKKLILLGDRIRAEDAVKIGLVDKVVPEKKLLDESRKLATKLVEGSPMALKHAKHAINLGTQFPLEVGLKLESQAFGIVLMTDDAREGVSAFLEKRKPNFSGK